MKSKILCYQGEFKDSVLKPALMFVSLLIFFQFLSLAQVTMPNPGSSYYKQNSHFGITRPLRELAKESPKKLSEQQKQKLLEFKKKDEAREVRESSEKKASQSSAMRMEQIADPARQTAQGEKMAAGPIVNIDGQRSPYWSPFDPSGAAGPSNYVQIINTSMAIYDKNGNTLEDTVSLSNIWPDDIPYIDVVVLYDKFADRWFLSIMGLNSEETAITTLLVAVSTSKDPGGSYYTYAFVPDVTTGALDYPKYSIWPDGYYVTMNAIYEPDVLVLDRTNMLLGKSNAGFLDGSFINNGVSTTSPLYPGENESASGYPGVSLPMFSGKTLSADGVLPPYGKPNYYIFFNDDAWGDGAPDELVIYKISTNWKNKSVTLALDATLSTDPFNSVFPVNNVVQHNGNVYIGAIDQPGMPASLDALQGFMNYRVPYMRFTDHNSVVCCHAVNLGSGGTALAGIRWYELRQDTAGANAWSIFQQGTYAPSDSLSRWNASIAMDINGNIGMGYCVSNGSTYPGLSYTGRLQGDIAGTMTFAETNAVAGSGTFTEDFRWGDYWHTSLDPDGVTFWHTNMYAGAGNGCCNDMTRIFSFQIGSSTGIPGQKTVQADVVAFQQGTMLNVKASDLPSGESALAVDLFTVDGKQVSRTMVSANSGMFQTSIDASGLARGVYLLRVGSSNFQKVIKVSLQ